MCENSNTLGALKLLVVVFFRLFFSSRPRSSLSLTQVFSLSFSSHFEKDRLSHFPAPSLLPPTPKQVDDEAAQKQTQAHIRDGRPAQRPPRYGGGVRSLPLEAATPPPPPTTVADETNQSINPLRASSFPLSLLQKNQSQPPNASAPTSRPRPRTWRWTVRRKRRRENEKALSINSPPVFCFGARLKSVTARMLLVPRSLGTLCPIAFNAHGLHSSFSTPKPK